MKHGPGRDEFQNVKLVSEVFPEKSVLFTEGCIEKFDYAKLNDWWLGERYGKSLVNDFNSGAVAWTDWNILLDENGGPNHAGNFCFAPIHADLRTGKLIYQYLLLYGSFLKICKSGSKKNSEFFQPGCIICHCL
jgi:glucosylceramidase